MSINAVIFIFSFIAFTMLNRHFLNNDYEYKKQNKEFSLITDPMGIRRFKQQPKKMLALMAILFGPISIYNLVLILNAG